MTAIHEHQFTTRVKRKVSVSQYGATAQNTHPDGQIVGHDYILLWKCATCPATQAYELERGLE